MPDTERTETKPPDAEQDAAPAAEQDAGGGEQEQVHIDVDADGDYAQDDQVYVERDKIDFDPDKGLYNGTAVDGTSSIPGPHERQDDVEAEDSDDAGENGESDSDG